MVAALRRRAATGCSSAGCPRSSRAQAGVHLFWVTLSIVARCARTGQIGVAAMTAVPAVGKLLDHAAAHVGAVATQARVNPYLGIDGIALLRQRRCADDVLAILRRSDPRIE